VNRCVVFAYHNVGVRCLSVLFDRKVDVSLVVTHQDEPRENIWFESVADLARLRGIPVITPEEPNAPQVEKRLRALDPDFIFSFYYRKMLGEALIKAPKRGALNMHGSLLPKFRGRAPVNWAIIKGEKETGASLHYMEAKPDSGPLVDQQAVPILEDDTALDVFHKVTWAAEVVLYRSLSPLLEGKAPRIPLDLKRGSYFGGRRPEDGRVDWNATALDIHNLIRAVAPPYPGAFTSLAGKPMRIIKSRVSAEPARHPSLAPCFYQESGRCYADCRDGHRLEIVDFELNRAPVSAQSFCTAYGSQPQQLGDLI
jgi:methionyl-tRNA formyltransferase